MAAHWHYTAPMYSSFRMLVIWLVALAFPVQVVGAATMKFCAPSHHAQMAHASTLHAGHAAHHEEAAAAAQHDHARMLAKAAEPAQSSTAMADSTMKMKCSACAACCMAAALAPPVPAVQAIEVATDITLPASAPYVEPDAHGLERPPRTFLA